MKYLLIFLFAGFCLTGGIEITKYKLSIEPKETEFHGEVTLTLNDISSDPLELDPYEYEITECIFYGEKKEPYAESNKTYSDSQIDILNNDLNPDHIRSYGFEDEPTVLEDFEVEEKKCTHKDNKIYFDGKRIRNEVTLRFQGKYSARGLAKYGTSSNDKFYVADMTKEDNAIIFPCQSKIKAELMLDKETVKMSNLDSMTDETGSVFLRQVFFIQGDIIKDSKSVPSFPFYHMKSSKEIGPRLKKLLEQAGELGVTQQVLFTPVFRSVGINSRDVVIVRDVLNPDDSTSDLAEVCTRVLQNIFQHQPRDKKTFLDYVGPTSFCAKISEVVPNRNEILGKFQSPALETDGFNNSLALKELTNEEETAKNPLLYSKGFSVFSALYSKCGRKNFIEGLSSYIKKSSSSVKDAFGKCFDDATGAEQFLHWTDLPGYPVVHVTLNKTVQYNVNQERFLWFGEKNDQKWTFPISYKTKEGSTKNLWLPATKDNTAVEINSTYFILNHDIEGFYRVNYDAKVWEALISQLNSNHSQIDPTSRARLIDDVFSFPKSTFNFSRSIPNYVTALKLSDYLTNETDVLALELAFNAFAYLDSALDSSIHGSFRTHVRGILRQLYKKISTTKTYDPEDGLLKHQITTWACKYGVEECVQNANKIFDNITLDESYLEESEKIAICSAVRDDTSKWIRSATLLSKTSMERAETIPLLACSRNKTVLSLFLAQFIWQKNEDEFKLAVKSAMENNPDNIDVILDIIKDLENEIKHAFGVKCLEDIVKFTLTKLNSKTADKLKKIAEKLNAKLKGEVDVVCKHVKLWTDVKAKSIKDYLTHKTGGGSQVKPVALILLVTALLPLANHIFSN